MDTITLDITILEPLEKVWQYYNDPKHIKNWYFADQTWYCKSAENDLVVGGEFNYRIDSKKESFGFNFEGVYDEIIPEKLIKAHLANGRQIEIHFEKVDDTTTRVTEKFEPKNDNLRDMQRDGWYAILNNFHKYVENN